MVAAWLKDMVTAAAQSGENPLEDDNRSCHICSRCARARGVRKCPFCLLHYHEHCLSWILANSDGPSEPSESPDEVLEQSDLPRVLRNPWTWHCCRIRLATVLDLDVEEGEAIEADEAS